MAKSDARQREGRENEALKTPTDLSRKGVGEISNALRQMLADVFALYVKTKNFHWHMSGAHFRDYHLLLDEHADQIFAMTDDIAERARKIGGNHAPFHQRHFAAPTPEGQQRGIRHPEGHAGRAVCGQPAPDTVPAFRPRGLRASTTMLPPPA